MRSWLTIVGVIIGVASVVAIISIGQGMQENMQERLGSFGADILTVIPGYFRATGVHSEMHTDRSVSSSSSINLTDNDYKVIASVRIREQMSDVTQTLSLFLSAIAAISLLVGAIGIANTMFMSVNACMTQPVKETHKYSLAYFALRACDVTYSGYMIPIYAVSDSCY